MIFHGQATRPQSQDKDEEVDINILNGAEIGAVTKARSRGLSDILRLQSQRNPNKIALSYEGHDDTFAGLDVAVTRAANGLRAAGIEPGDRVAMLSHNNRAFVILRFAIIRAGAIFTPINFMLNAEEVSYILAHSEARAIIAEDALCATADRAISGIGNPPLIKAFINHTGTEPPLGWSDVESWFEYPDDVPPAVARTEDDPVQIMYTSGTESRPKGALLSTRALLAQYVSCVIDGGMEEDDVELHCLPLYHCAQLDAFLSVDLYLGARSVLMRAPDPAAMLQVIERERINKLFCPPTVWISLLRHADFDRHDLSSLTKGYYGASIMPTAVIEELSNRLPQLKLWNFYGQTELAPVATVLRPEDQFTKLGSAGKPALNVETLVVDDDDRAVPPGIVGEIVHRSPQAMLGYFRDEEKTVEAFRGGWFHSGDLGRFDEDGYLYVVDRKKDMIKSGGENVASREVEELLFTHPGIAEVAVFGVPDPKWIEAVIAVIVCRAGASVAVEEVHTLCRDKLAGYKRPKHIHVVDSLPKNASGKILKRELRAQFIGLAST